MSIMGHHGKSGNVYKNCLKKDCESEMNVMGEGDSEKQNIDVKTSARQETHSLEYTSTAIQTDLSMQDTEELENLKQSQEAGTFTAP